MSKPVNFLDLIKNPDKINNQNVKQHASPSQGSGSIPKEAVIPPNLSGAQKNEWMEMQKRVQKINQEKNDDDVIILDSNPFKNNQDQSNNKQLIQKQNLQTIQPRIINSGKKDANIQSASKPAQQQQQQNYAQQFQTIQTRQNNVRLGDDQINYRPSQNQEKATYDRISQNQMTSADISKKHSIQFNNSDKKNINQIGSNQIVQQQQKVNPTRATIATTTTTNTVQSNNQKVQQNRSIGSVFSSTNSKKSTGMSKQEMLRAKYSLKNESKEDYKKIFSRIVKEYSDEENRYYDANKTRSTTYIIYTLIVIVLVMAFFDGLAAYTPKFCGTGKVNKDKPNCLVCPEFATCKHYVMRCNEGYIQKDYKCILNPNLISSSKSFIIQTITEMQYQNGHRLCFQPDIPSDQNKDDLSSDSKSSTNEDFTEGNKIKLDVLIQELTNRIADVKSVDSQKAILTSFLESKSNQKEYDFQYDWDHKTLSTSRIRFTLFCKSKNFIKTNQRGIAVSCILFVIMSIIGTYIKHHLKLNRIANEIYNELLTQIQSSSEKQINISYYKEGIVNRYKSDFNESVWILVDKKRFNDRKINVYRDFDGLYWSQI